MKIQKTLALFILAAITASACYQNESSSKPTASFGANALANSETTRLIEKRKLDVSGFQILNEFIRPDVKTRLDEEPAGDADSDFSPAVADSGIASDASSGDTSAEPFAESDAEPIAKTDESAASVTDIERAKFSWAKKRLGEMLRTDESAAGMIVLFADENFYDTAKLLAFIEDGRNRIASETNIQPERIQVSFGGYRSTPQVEFWLVPYGQPLPELRADDRDQPEGPAK